MDEHAMTALDQSIGAAIQYARSSEKLMAATRAMLGPGEALQALIEYDPDLKPEVLVALNHLSEALTALQRASAFQDARFDAALARIRTSLPPQEGDPQ